MKKILSAFLLLSVLACHSQTNINVIYSFLNGLGEYQYVKQFSVQPMSGTFSNAYIIGDEVKRVITGPYYTNRMISGLIYKVKFYKQTQPDVISATFTNYFPTNISGTVYASDWTAVSTNLGNGIYAYSMSQVDALLANLTNGFFDKAQLFDQSISPNFNVASAIVYNGGGQGLTGIAASQISGLPSTNGFTGTNGNFKGTFNGFGNIQRATNADYATNAGAASAVPASGVTAGALASSVTVTSNNFLGSLNSGQIAGDVLHSNSSEFLVIQAGRKILIGNGTIIATLLTNGISLSSIDSLEALSMNWGSGHNPYFETYNGSKLMRIYPTNITEINGNTGSHYFDLSDLGFTGNAASATVASAVAAANVTAGALPATVTVSDASLSANVPLLTSGTLALSVIPVQVNTNNAYASIAGNLTNLSITLNGGKYVYQMTNTACLTNFNTTANATFATLAISNGTASATNFYINAAGYAEKNSTNVLSIPQGKIMYLWVDAPPGATNYFN